MTGCLVEAGWQTRGVGKTECRSWVRSLLIQSRREAVRERS